MINKTHLFTHTVLTHTFARSYLARSRFGAPFQQQTPEQRVTGTPVSSIQLFMKSLRGLFQHEYL